MEAVLSQMGEPADFLFIGGSILDTQWLDYAKIPYKKIISDKWRGYFSPKNILAILKFPVGLIQTLFFVAVYFPDVYNLQRRRGVLDCQFCWLALWYTDCCA